MKYLIRAAVLLALIGATVACFDTILSSNQGQGQAGQGGGGVTGPSQPTSITAVAVSKFGEDCDGGATPTDNPTTVRVGCTARVTCTSKCGSRDCIPAEHGASPDFFGVVSGNQYVQVSGEDNLWNLRFRALGPGDVAYKCTAGGIDSPVRTLTVVN